MQRSSASSVQKEQEAYYSGKKKYHTVKSQIIADVETHDFTLCKETLLLVMILAVMILADNGYQGIQAYHEWSLIPIKKSKKQELSDSEKAFNRELSRRLKKKSKICQKREIC